MCDTVLDAIGKFQELYEIVQSRTMMDDATIDRYQFIADSFFSLWIDVAGREGVTNYIHGIGAGHYYSFLKKERNLYKFSQQGWEHHNKRMLGIYHRHTQKGGKGAKQEEVGHIRPLFAHETRCWMWKTGKGDLFFEEEDRNEASRSSTTSSSSTT